MPADEECARAILLDAGHHAELARLAEQQLGARIELVGKQVAKGAMRIVDDDRCRAARERAADGGVRFPGHQPASALELGIAGTRLFRMHDARDAFDVDRDQYLHRLSACSSRAFQPGTRSVIAYRTCPA